MHRDTLEPSPAALTMSPELVCHCAHFLSYRDAWIAASICRGWRAALLADPFIWTQISVYLTEGTFKHWLSTLKTLIARSAQRPLTLELKCDEQNTNGPLFNALEVVAAFLAGHMGVMKSLSVTIPTCDTKYWYRVLRQRAPLLEVLRIHCSIYMDDTPRLPMRIFDGHAPRLHSLVLEQAYFPDFIDNLFASAFANITSLCFHAAGSIQRDDLWEHLAPIFPRLQHLACSVPVMESYTVAPHCNLELHLRLNVADGAREVVAGFPRAKSVLYSYAGDGGDDMLDIVEDAIRRVSQQTITSVVIAWTPLQANSYWVRHLSRPRPFLSLSMNGRPVVVDIPLEMLRDALTPAAIAHFSHSVQTLAVVEEIWDLFAAVDMPALRDLSLRLPPHDDWTAAGAPFDGTSAAHQYRIDALRLIRAPEQAVDVLGAAVPAVAIAHLIQSVVAAGSSPTLYLYGLSMGTDESAALDGDIAARIIYEAHPGEPIVETWSWEPADDMVVPGRRASTTDPTA